jgi:hypothetical protein
MNETMSTKAGLIVGCEWSTCWTRWIGEWLRAANCSAAVAGSCVAVVTVASTGRSWRVRTPRTVPLLGVLGNGSEVHKGMNRPIAGAGAPSIGPVRPVGRW